MIEFLKSQIDDDVKRLLLFLGPDYPLETVCLEIKQGHAAAVKVILNGSLIGLLILKTQKTYDDKKILLIHHGIAEANCRDNFSKMLSTHIFAYAYQMGFDLVHQHAEGEPLRRLFEKYYGNPQEYIFKKDLNQWAKAHPALAQARQQQAIRQA